MGRRLVSTVATESMKRFIGSGGAKRKRNPGSYRKAHIEDVRARVASGDWTDLQPSRLVALYWYCHEAVYGVTPVELDSASQWKTAMMQAANMVKRKFDGDVPRAIVFMRWLWAREREREKWRRDNGRHGRRINWRQQFVYGDFVTEWELEKRREQCRK